MHIIKTVYAWICRVEVMVSMINLVVCTALIFLSAFMRSINRPMNWSQEIALFLFAWCVFLSADIALRENRLVCLDMVTQRLPRTLQLACSLLSYTLIIVFLGAMVYFGSRLSYTTRFRTLQGIPNFSYTWITISLPAAALLMTITSFLKIRDILRALFGRVPAPPPPAEHGDIPVM